jgi:hypothetical protein
MRVKITLNPYNREQAVTMRLKRGVETPADFEGPEFTNARGVVSTDMAYLKVHLDDGTMYLYPHTSIARVGLYAK